MRYGSSMATLTGLPTTAEVSVTLPLKVAVHGCVFAVGAVMLLVEREKVSTCAVVGRKASATL